MTSQFGLGQISWIIKAEQLMEGNPALILIKGFQSLSLFKFSLKIQTFSGLHAAEEVLDNAHIEDYQRVLGRQHFARVSECRDRKDERQGDEE